MSVARETRVSERLRNFHSLASTFDRTHSTFASPCGVEIVQGIITRSIQPVLYRWVKILQSMEESKAKKKRGGDEKKSKPRKKKVGWKRCKLSSCSFFPLFSFLFFFSFFHFLFLMIQDSLIVKWLFHFVAAFVAESSCGFQQYNMRVVNSNYVFFFLGRCELQERG